jgi:hypothetical protein
VHHWHREERSAVIGCASIMNRDDRGMIKLGKGSPLSLEPSKRRTRVEIAPQNFERAKSRRRPSGAREVDNPVAALTNARDEFVSRDAGKCLSAQRVTNNCVDGRRRGEVDGRSRRSVGLREHAK